MVKLTHKDRYQDLLATTSLLFLLSLLVFSPFTVQAQEKGVEWGPYLTVEQGAGLVLNWKTFPSVYSEVDYGSTISYWKEGEFSRRIEVQPSEDGFQHSALTNTEPGARYAYRINRGKVNYLTTFSNDPEEFNFFVYSDTQNCYQRHRIVASEMALDPVKPTFILHAGDLVTSPLATNWKHFFWAIEPYSNSTPLLPVLGNHEKNDDSYYNAFDLPDGGGDYDEQWYSFVYGDAQFIFLDSNAGEMGLGSFLEQKRWLKEQLEGCSRPIKVVIFHHPIFSSKYSKGVDIGLANSWHKLFKEYGVDLVFSGHIHSYERSERDGITYIVAGGGGGPPGNLQSRFDFSQRVVTHTLHYMRVMVRKNEVTVQMIKVADLEEGAGKWTCDDKIVVNREVMDEVSFKY